MIFLILLTPPPDSDLDDSPDKVTLDDERLPDDAPKGLQKVELDLDDALFLECEEDEPAPSEKPELPPEETPPPQSGKEKKTSKPIWKKLWFLAAVGVLVLLLAAGGTYFFIRNSGGHSEQNATTTNASADTKTETKHGEENATPEGEEGKQGEHNATNQTAVLPSVSFAPFEIEYTRGDKVQFLYCKFTVYKVSEKMMLEMKVKSILLRDALYRYLKNTDLALLENPDNTEQIKINLMTVMNQILKSGKVTELLFDEYLVK